MLSRLALVFVIAVFLAAASAEASVSGGTRPYERWLERAPVEAPAADVEVIETRCPFAPVSACTRSDTTTIWLERRPGFTKGRFFHELGHQYDYHSLTDYKRARLLGLLRRGVWVNRARGTQSAHELFAEAYRQCAGGHEGQQPIRKLRRICRMVRA